MEQRSNPFSAVLNNFKLDINGSVGTLITFFDNWLKVYPYIRQPSAEDLVKINNLLAELREYFQSRRLNDWRHWPQVRVDTLTADAYTAYCDAVCGTWELGFSTEQVTHTLTGGVLEYFYNPGKMFTAGLTLDKAIERKHVVGLFAPTAAGSEYVALIDLLERTSKPDRSGWNEGFAFTGLRGMYIASDSGSWVNIITDDEPAEEDATTDEPVYAQQVRTAGLRDSERLEDLPMAVCLVRDSHSGVNTFDLSVHVEGSPSTPTRLNFTVTKETVSISATQRHHGPKLIEDRYSATPLDWLRIFADIMPATPAALLRQRLNLVGDDQRQVVDHLVLPTDWFCTQYPGLLIGAPVETVL